MTSSRSFGALHVTLYVVALLLGCACVVGGVRVFLEHRDAADAGTAGLAAPSDEVQQEYGAVKKAADATATALVNISFRDPQASLDQVATTATGTFLEQYTASSDGLVQLVKTYRAVLTGEVAETAVSTIDDDSAVVLVATKGTVRNTATGTTAQARDFRLLITLVKTDDRWMANDLEFVG